MFVRELLFEDRRGKVTVKNPDWREIEEAIKGLDGHRATLVTLATDADAHMAIGGGEDGKYVAYITFDNLKFNTLIDPSNSDDEVSIVAGGQEGNYPGKAAVDLATVLKSTRTFAESGQLDQTVHWKQ